MHQHPLRSILEAARGGQKRKANLPGAAGAGFAPGFLNGSRLATAQVSNAFPVAMTARPAEGPQL
jgi:hypothetical protein